MKNISSIRNDTIWPITVAIAAPVTPSFGIPNQPNINIGSRIIFKIAPIICEIVGNNIFPVAWKTFSKVSWKNKENESNTTI